MLLSLFLLLFSLLSSLGRWVKPSRQGDGAWWRKVCAWWGAIGETKAAELPLRPRFSLHHGCIRLYASHPRLQSHKFKEGFLLPYTLFLSRTGLARDLSYSQRLCIFVFCFFLFPLNPSGESLEQYLEEEGLRMPWKKWWVTWFKFGGSHNPSRRVVYNSRCVNSLCHKIKYSENKIAQHDWSWDMSLWVRARVTLWKLSLKRGRTLSTTERIWRTLIRIRL